MPLSSVRTAVLTIAASWLVGASVCTPATAASKTCKQYTLDRDEVRIDGRVGDAESFAGVFHLTTDAKEQQPEVQTAGDLETAGNNKIIIPESRITISNPGKLRSGVSGTVRITVGGVRFAGEYRGKLAVADATGCRIDLTVLAHGSPKLAVVGDKVNLGLVRCASQTCGPANVVKFLVPARSRRDGIAPQVSNDGQGPASITAIDVRIVGDAGEGTVPEGAISPTEQQALLLPGKATPLPPIAIGRDRLSPDHYHGSINLTVAGEEGTVALPIDLNVKDGPFWALVLVLVALLTQLGFLVAQRNRPRGAALAKLRASRRSTFAVGDDAKLFDGRLAAALDAIVNGDLEGAAAAQAGITTDIGRVKEARELERTAKERVSPLPDGIATALATFRGAIAEGRGNDANSALTDLRIAVENLPPPAAEPSGAVAAPSASQEIPLSAAPRWTGPLLGWLRGVVAALAGAVGRVLHATWRGIRYGGLWFTIVPLPWLISVPITIGLVAFALKGYFDDATFGSDIVADYLLLFATVLAANIAPIALDKVLAR